MPDTLRVLYVDDESALLEIGKLFLEQSGDFTVTTAQSVTEAIRLLEQEKFDAIISDYQMPGMDGIQFLVKVRSRFGSIPFILFTGRGREEVVIQAINSGADFYLQKGGEPEAQFAELAHKIKAAASSKRADDALRISEERYRVALEVTGQIGWSALPDGSVEDMPMWRQYSGLSVEGIKGWKWLDSIHPDDRESVNKVWRNAVQKQEIYYSNEYRIRRADGVYRNFLVRSMPLLDADGSIREWIGTCIDITGRKKAENEILFKNVILATQQETSPDAVLIVDENGKILSYNQKFISIFGIPDELIASRVDEPVLQFVAGQLADPEAFLCRVRYLYDHKGEKSFEELQLRDGRTLERFSSPMLGETGTYYGRVWYYRDITGRRQQEFIQKVQLKLGLALQGTSRLPEALALCLASAIEIAGMDAGGIYLVDPVDGSLDLAVSSNLGEEFVRLGSHYPSDSENTRVIMEGKSQYMPYRDTGTIDTTAKEKEGLLAVGIIPIASNGQVIACLNVTSHAFDEIPVSARIALETISSQIGTAIRRARSEEALKKSEQDLKTAQAIARLGRWELDLVHNTLHWSDGIYQIFEINPAEFRATYEAFLHCIHPDDRDGVNAAYTDSLKTKKPYEITHRLRMKDGRIKWVNEICRTDYDAKGHPLRSVGIVQDITGSMQADEVLQFTRHSIDSATETLVTIAKDGHFADVNDAFCRKSGYSKEELLTMTIHDIDPDYNAEIWSAFWNKLKQSGSLTFESTHRSKDGKTYPVEITSTYFEYRGNEYQCSFAHDISGRKQAEEALLQKHEELEAANEELAATGEELKAQFDALMANEKSLRETEGRVRQKLESLLAPEGDIGNLELGDIIDKQALQRLMDDFTRLSGMGMAILDTKGNVLVATGWQEICTKFHRVNPVTAGFCTESDLHLAKNMKQGEYVAYHCRNHLWDVVTPLYIGSKHMGNIFTGQFFYDDDIVDDAIFIKQAEIYGFDRVEYLAALHRVPKFSRTKIQELMDYLIKLTGFLSLISYRNLKLARTVTERDTLLTSLQKSEGKFRTLVENIPQKIFTKDLDSRYVTINENFARDLGMRPGEIAGKSDADLFPAELAAVYQANDARVLKTGQTGEFEERYLLDGKETWVRTIKTVIRDEAGEIAGLLGVFWDITDRKRAEDGLKKSEALLSRVFDILPAGLWLADRTGTLVRSNEAGRRIWGAEPPIRQEEYGVFKARRLPSREEIAPDDWALAHTISKGITVSGELLEIDAFDGKTRTILNSTAPVLDENGNVEGAVIVNLDISELVRSQEALRTLAEVRHGTDDDLLRVLVRQLALSQGVQYALIARIYPDDPGTAHTLAVWAGSDFGDNFRYSLDGTPCENVTMKGSCFYPGDIRQLFPRDQLLADMNAESYWGTPLQDNNGQAIGILAILDVKPMEEHPEALALLKSFAIRASQELERMQAEEALRNSEEYYRTILQTTKDGFWTLDAHTGRFLDVNETYCKMSGYSRAEVLDMGINDIDSIEDPVKTREHIQRIITNGSDLFEARHRRKDGSLFDVEISVTYFPSEGGKFICFCRDITERKQAEENIRQQTDAMEAAIDGLAILNADQNYTYVNTAHAAIYGYGNARELLGRSWRTLYNSDELQRFEQEIMPELGRKGHYRGEANGKKKDGSTFPQEISLTALENGGLICVVRDITGRKMAEERLKESEERYRSLYVDNRDAIMLVSPERGFIAANPAAIQLFALRDENDFIACSPASLSPGYQPDGVLSTNKSKEMMHLALEKGSNFFEWTHRKSDGTEFPAWVLLSRLESGGTQLLQATVRDITERKKAEVALKESESFLNILLESIPIPVFYKDREGRYLGFNKAFENFYGKSKEQLMGKSVFDISPPELAKVYHAADIGLFEKPGIQVYDSQVLDSHGILHDVIFHKASLTDTQGSVTGLIGAILDITERKVAEEALRETEANYRQVINTIDETLSVIDPDGNFLFANNNAALNLSGGTPEDVTGKNIREFVPCGQAELLIEKYRSVVASGQPVKGDIRISLKSGELWFSNVLQPLHYGQTKVPAVLSISLDITERKRAEECLKESEERFKSYIENSPEGVFIADERGCYLEVNPGACRITGYEKEELLAMQISDILPPESTEAGLKHFKELIEYGHAFGELLFRHKDGSLRYWSVDAVRLTPTRFIGFVKDITKRKVAEESLRVANKKLKLLSGITRHDISNQITVLMGYLRMLEKKQPETMHNEYFLKINAAAQRILSMIEFTREYEYIGVKAPAWHDCRTLADTAAKDAPLGKVIVKNDLPAGAEVFADPLVVKVFYNLMDNAARYGGKITTIRFSVEEREGVHVVVCEDDGDGVVADEKEKIFERGFGKNTGLGLALSRDVLDITGITILETGEPGNSARFEMAVPKGAWRIVGSGE